MIVCLCRGVSDRAIRQLAAAGATDADQVRAACGAGGSCGSCLPDVQRICDDVHGRSTAVLPSRPHRLPAIPLSARAGSPWGPGPAGVDPR